VVFSHCFTCNKDLKAIVRLGRDLAARGVTVLRYDMTGLGNSDGDFSKTDFTTNLADLRAAVAYMLGAFGRVTGLLGHSFTGCPKRYPAPREFIGQTQSRNRGVWSGDG
jgi:putative redox protein